MFFFWLIHTILTGPSDSISMVKGKNSNVITSFVISFFPSKALDKKGKRDTNTTTDIPDKQEEKLKPGHEGHKHLILGFRAITILFKKTLHLIDKKSLIYWRMGHMEEEQKLRSSNL